MDVSAKEKKKAKRNYEVEIIQSINIKIILQFFFNPAEMKQHVFAIKSIAVLSGSNRDLRVTDWGEAGEP